MTETEKKLASNASLLTGVTMLVAMPFWFEIIVVSDQILMLPWMVMSFALIVMIYFRQGNRTVNWKYISRYLYHCEKSLKY